MPSLACVPSNVEDLRPFVASLQGDPEVPGCEQLTHWNAKIIEETVG
jgi:hypothetical protein